MLTRRNLLQRATAISAGFMGLRAFADGAESGSVATQSSAGVGGGALVEDLQGVLDLPAGFSYRVFSKPARRWTMDF